MDRDELREKLATLPAEDRKRILDSVTDEEIEKIPDGWGEGPWRIRELSPEEARKAGSDVAKEPISPDEPTGLGCHLSPVKGLEERLRAVKAEHADNPKATQEEGRLLKLTDSLFSHGVDLLEKGEAELALAFGFRAGEMLQKYYRERHRKSASHGLKSENQTGRTHKGITPTHRAIWGRAYAAGCELLENDGKTWRHNEGSALKCQILKAAREDTGKADLTWKSVQNWAKSKAE